MQVYKTNKDKQNEQNEIKQKPGYEDIDDRAAHGKPLNLSNRLDEKNQGPNGEDKGDKTDKKGARTACILNKHVVRMSDQKQKPHHKP